MSEQGSSFPSKASGALKFVVLLMADVGGSKLRMAAGSQETISARPLL